MSEKRKEFLECLKPNKEEPDMLFDAARVASRTAERKANEDPYAYLQQMREKNEAKGEKVDEGNIVLAAKMIARNLKKDEGSRE